MRSRKKTINLNTIMRIIEIKTIMNVTKMRQKTKTSKIEKNVNSKSEFKISLLGNVVPTTM